MKTAPPRAVRRWELSMAVTIRLRRAGNRNNAFFHVVATDSRHARDGRCLERLGHYDPRSRPSVFAVDRERVNHWLSKGAVASRTVSELLAKNKAATVAGEVAGATGGEG